MRCRWFSGGSGRRRLAKVVGVVLDWYPVLVDPVGAGAGGLDDFVGPRPSGSVKPWRVTLFPGVDPVPGLVDMRRRLVVPVVSLPVPVLQSVVALDPLLACGGIDGLSCWWW